MALRLKYFRVHTFFATLRGFFRKVEQESAVISSSFFFFLSFFLESHSSWSTAKSLRRRTHNKSEIRLLNSNLPLCYSVLFVERSNGCSRGHRPVPRDSPTNLHQLSICAHLQHDRNPVSCRSVWTPGRGHEAMDGEYCDGGFFSVCCCLVTHA